MRKPKFEIIRTSSGRYVWQLKATNGRIRCQGELNLTYNNAVRAIKGTVKSVGGDPENIIIVDRCGTGARP